CVAVVAGPTASVQLTLTCWPAWPLETCTNGVANATYEEPPGRDFVRMETGVVSLATVTGVVVRAPNSCGGADAHVACPEELIAEIAWLVAEQVPATRACSWLRLARTCPTAPGWI